MMVSVVGAVEDGIIFHLKYENMIVVVHGGILGGFAQKMIHVNSFNNQ